MGPLVMDETSHFNFSKGNTIYAATKIKPFLSEHFKYDQFR